MNAQKGTTLKRASVFQLILFVKIITRKENAFHVIEVILLIVEDVQLQSQRIPTVRILI